jgi:hypothetical protein
MTGLYIPRQVNITVRWERQNVLLIINGQLVLDVQWQQALELGRALIAQARKADTWVNAQQVIDDQALLLRAGVPVTLAGDPVMLKEAGNEAAWNSDLRRYLPNRDISPVYGKMHAPMVFHAKRKRKKQEQT